MSRPFANDNVFRAVADPTRRRLLEELRKGERSALELGQLFRITAPTLSYHLGILRTAGLLTQRRAGQRRIYRLQRAPLRPALVWLQRCERTGAT